jgi:hypothetical protein
VAHTRKHSFHHKAPRRFSPFVRIPRFSTPLHRRHGYCALPTTGHLRGPWWPFAVSKIYRSNNFRSTKSIHLCTELFNRTVVKPRRTCNGTVVKTPEPANGTVVKTPESTNGTAVDPPKPAIGTDLPRTQTTSQPSPVFCIRSTLPPPRVQPPPSRRHRSTACLRLFGGLISGDVRIGQSYAIRNGGPALRPNRSASMQIGTPAAGCESPGLVFQPAWAKQGSRGRTALGENYRTNQGNQCGIPHYAQDLP